MVSHGLSGILIFFVDKMCASFCSAKAPNFIFQQKMVAFLHLTPLKFNVLSTTGTVSFKQLGPAYKMMSFKQQGPASQPQQSRYLAQRL